MVVVNKEQESFYLQRNYNRCDEHEKVAERYGYESEPNQVEDNCAGVLGLFIEEKCHDIEDIIDLRTKK